MRHLLPLLCSLLLTALPGAAPEKPQIIAAAVTVEPLSPLRALVVPRDAALGWPQAKGDLRYSGGPGGAQGWLLVSSSVHPVPLVYPLLLEADGTWKLGLDVAGRADLVGVQVVLQLVVWKNGWMVGDRVGLKVE